MQDQNQPTTFTPNAPIVGGAEPPVTAAPTPDWQQGLVPGATGAQPGVTPPQFQQPEPVTQVLAPDESALNGEQPALAEPAFMQPEPAIIQQPAQDPVPLGTSEKNYVVAFLFASIFGFLAFDRFYLKKYITGVLKLLTFGGLGIWVAIDIYKIGTGAARTKDGQQLADTEKYVHIGRPVAKAIIIYTIIVTILYTLLWASLIMPVFNVGPDESTSNSGFSESVPAENFVDTGTEGVVE
jgi:TM2 domain-containing membrane protein YozV